MPKASPKVSSIFGSAETRTRGSGTGTSRVTEAKEVLLKGIRDLKACKRLEAVFHALAEEIGDRIKTGPMATIFIDKGCASKLKPESFDATDEGQIANCQIRLRSFGSNGMDDNVYAEFEAAGLDNLVEEKATFSFDQEKLTPHLMAQIDVALSKIDLPEGLLIRTVRRTLNKNAIASVFAEHHDDRPFVETALKLVATPAIRCNYDKTDTDLTSDIERVTTLLQDSVFSDTIKKAASDPNGALDPRKASPKKKAA
jgi:hypothetical protein